MAKEETRECKNCVDDLPLIKFKRHKNDIIKHTICNKCFLDSSLSKKRSQETKMYDSIVSIAWG